MFNLNILPSRGGKSLLVQTYVDYAATHPEVNFMLGTSNPAKWEKYLKENHPNVKYKIAEGGIIINPKK